MASWAARIPTRSCRRRAFSILPYRPVLEGDLCAQRGSRAGRSRRIGATNRLRSDWRALLSANDIDLIDIASPNDTHAEIAIAAAKAGKMVLCEKPLGRTAAEAKAMVDAVESAKVPNMVWYNYRRVPAVVLLKKLARRRPLRPHLSLSIAVSAGLDDLQGSSAGRRGTVASG